MSFATARAQSKDPLPLTTTTDTAKHFSCSIPAETGLFVAAVVERIPVELRYGTSKGRDPSTPQAILDNYVRHLDFFANPHRYCLRKSLYEEVEIAIYMIPYDHGSFFDLAGSLGYRIR